MQILATYPCITQQTMIVIAPAIEGHLADSRDVSHRQSVIVMLFVLVLVHVLVHVLVVVSLGVTVGVQGSLLLCVGRAGGRT